MVKIVEGGASLASVCLVIGELEILNFPCAHPNFH